MIAGSIYSLGLSERTMTCRQCGRRFPVYDKKRHAFRDGKTLLCSWHCLRAWRRKKGADMEKRTRTYITEEIAAKVVSMHSEGKLRKEIANELGISLTAVQNALKKVGVLDPVLDTKPAIKPRPRPRQFTLRDILALISDTDSLPDQWKSFEDILPNAGNDIELCFMSERETHIVTYSRHPMLIPWYDCPVDSITPIDNMLEVWLDYEPFLLDMVGLQPEPKKEDEADGDEAV